MSAAERAVIYVESGPDLSSLAVAASTTATTKTSSSSRNGTSMANIRTITDHSSKTSTTTAVVTTAGAGCGSNYVIKIQIGEENMFNHPVRIDVSTGKSNHHKALRQNKNGNNSTTAIEDDSALSSSGQSSPRSDMTPPPRINSGAIRFGSETSESDTESDVSSEFRPVPCQAAQFALREICEVNTPSPPPMPRSMMKNQSKMGGNNTSSAYKPSQFQVSSSASKKGGSSDFMSLAGVRGAPDNRRMKTCAAQPSGKSTPAISPECLKAKAELEAEILKRGKLLGTGVGSAGAILPKKVSSIRNKEKALKDISENGTFMVTPTHMTGFSGSISLKSPGEKCLFKKSSEGAILTEPNGFHINEINECNSKENVVNEGTSESLSNFAGYRDIFSRNTGANPIMSDKGTIRGVKNRVRDGIATFLQTTDSKVRNSIANWYFTYLTKLSAFESKH